MGSSKADLLELPAAVIREFGYALYLAQIGQRHKSTVPLKGQGDAAVLEVIQAGRGSTYRAVYTVRFAGVVIVLHVFQKKSKSGRATPRADLKLVQQRLRQAARLAAELAS